MSKIRLTLLSMLVVFAASAIASASAAAANGCEESKTETCTWKLNGALLVGGERTLKRQWNSTQTLKGTAGGAAVTLISKLLTLENAVIIGGTPGKDKGKLVFTSVEVAKPAGCKVTNKEVKTKALKSELVELVKAGTPQKTDDVLFEPETGTVFAELTFENNPTCPINNVTANVEGTVQAEIEAPKGENPSHTLKAQGAAAWEFRRHGDKTATASQLKLGGKNAVFEGTTNVALADGHEWGAG